MKFWDWVKENLAWLIPAIIAVLTLLFGEGIWRGLKKKGQAANTNQSGQAFIDPDKPNHSYEMGQAYYEQLKYKEAIEFFMKSAEEYEQQSGVSTLDRARALNSAGLVLVDRAEYEKALERYIEARAIYGAKGGAKELASIFNNIAFVYWKQGRYDEALRWHRKALTMQEKKLGKKHTDTAVTYHNIARMYDVLGEYEEALKWYFKALPIREKKLGKEHPDTAWTYNNIANVYANQGKYEEALKWYFMALPIREKVLGKENPDTAWTYNNIAIVYGDQKKFDDAFELYLKAYRIRLAKLGEEHPLTQQSRNNMRNTYDASGRTQFFDEWLNEQLADD